MGGNGNDLCCRLQWPPRCNDSHALDFLQLLLHRGLHLCWQHGPVWQHGSAFSRSERAVRDDWEPFVLISSPARCDGRACSERWRLMREEEGETVSGGCRVNLWRADFRCSGREVAPRKASNACVPAARASVCCKNKATFQISAVSGATVSNLPIFIITEDIIRYNTPLKITLIKLKSLAGVLLYPHPPSWHTISHINPCVRYDFLPTNDKSSEDSDLCNYSDRTQL